MIFQRIKFSIIFLIAGFFIFSHCIGCAGYKKQKVKIMRKGGTIFINKSSVKIWTGLDRLFCDDAINFFKRNNIEYVEKDFDCIKSKEELFNLAKKLNFNTYLLDGVPIIVLDNKIIIPGFSENEMSCKLLNKKCEYKVKGYDRFMQVKEHKKGD